MLGYKIKLRAKSSIVSRCYETEQGELGQDGIRFNYELLKSNGFFTSNVTLLKADNVADEQLSYLIQNSVGAKIYVHFDWIGTFNGEPTLIEHKVLDDTMVQVTDNFIINPTTTELINKSSLPLCACGALGTINLGAGKHICKDCNDHLTVPRSYSYKPSPYKYVGKQLTKDKETPVWYGLEIEVSTNKTKLGKFMHKHHGEIYLKSDSSIRGNNHNVEIVTHPHSFSELMKEGSWLEDISSVPTNDANDNGVHIHISRTAFKDDKHYSLFYFLLHKMHKVAVKVGGRELTNYCKLMPNGKVHTKKKDSTRGPNGREVFLNESNTDTVEARFFKSTTKTANLKAYIQLLESLVKYTKYHATSVDVNGWFEYITEKSTKYKELVKVVGTLSTEQLEINVVYREPIEVLKTLTSFSIEDGKKVSKIKRFDGSFVLGYIYEIYFADSVLYLRDDEGHNNRVNFSEIETIYVEED